jgi:hypothetical protein
MGELQLSPNTARPPCRLRPRAAADSGRIRRRRGIGAGRGSGHRHRRSDGARRWRRHRRRRRGGGGRLAPIQPATPEERNEWNVVWESYAGVLFFAMDSSLECFTHALNALGYLLNPSDFIDITDDRKLRQITPANLLDPPTEKNAKQSVYMACLGIFLQICAHWSANRDLIAQIIEYHDTTKHRHSAVVGQGLECHFLKLEPKQAMDKVAFNTIGLVAYDDEESLQSITASYQEFIVEWLRIARQEFEEAFGQRLPAPPA